MGFGSLNPSTDYGRTQQPPKPGRSHGAVDHMAAIVSNARRCQGFTAGGGALRASLTAALALEARCGHATDGTVSRQPVARIERSEMRRCSPRMSLRSIRATRRYSPLRPCGANGWKRAPARSGPARPLRPPARGGRLSTEQTLTVVPTRMKTATRILVSTVISVLPCPYLRSWADGTPDPSPADPVETSR
jgi:hypothetical protein